MKIAELPRRLEIAFWVALVALMRSRHFGRILLSSGALVLGLVVFVLGTALASQEGANQEAVPLPYPQSEFAAQPVALPNGQQNWLLILVDDLGATRPLLWGAWLAVRSPEGPTLIFLPIYPAKDDPAAARLVQIPPISDEGMGLAPELVTALQAQGVWWTHYLALDADLLSSLVDALGGIDLGEGVILGEQTLALLRNAQTDPSLLVATQSEVIGALCERLNPADDRQALVTAWLAHTLTDLSAAEVEAGWERAGQGGPLCDFPLLGGGE